MNEFELEQLALFDGAADSSWHYWTGGDPYSRRGGILAETVREAEGDGPVEDLYDAIVGFVTAATT